MQQTTTRAITLFHKDAKIPVKAHKLDAGHDCYLVDDLIIPAKSTVMLEMGFAVEVKEGEVMSIRSRGSTKKRGIVATDSTCDAGYRGPLFAFLYNTTNEAVFFKKGDRVVQLVFEKLSECYDVPIVQRQLPFSERDKANLGSSGA